MNYTKRFVKLAEEGKISESTLVKMSELKDRLSDHTVKIARNVPAKAGTTFGKMLLLAGALGAVAPVAGVIEDAVTTLKNNKLREPSFNKMLEYHPQLKNEDMETIQKYFDSIWHFSPHMAQDPLAAGSYIRGALQYHNVTGGPTPNMVGDLANLQKNVAGGGSYSPSRFVDMSKTQMPELLAGGSFF
jgi:hypothetical protein